MNYEELIAHVGHKVVVVQYGDNDNVAIECTKCHQVLLDFNNEENEENEDNMDIPDKFCKMGKHKPTKTVGELIKALQELPENLRIDTDACLPVVFNSQSPNPFFRLENPEDFDPWP